MMNDAEEDSVAPTHWDASFCADKAEEHNIHEGTSAGIAYLLLAFLFPLLTAAIALIFAFLPMKYQNFNWPCITWKRFAQSSAANTAFVRKLLIVAWYVGAPSQLRFDCLPSHPPLRTHAAFTSCYL